VLASLGDTEAYQDTCRKAFQRFHASEDNVIRADLVVLCCLSPSAGVDTDRLSAVADTVKTEHGDRSYGLLVKAMAEYRAGRYPEAIDHIVDKGFQNPPKDTLFALLFRAMALNRAGHTDLAKQLLRDAQREIPAQVLPFDRPFNPQSRPIVWCMLQALLHEAEETIQASNGPQVDHTQRIIRTDYVTRMGVAPDQASAIEFETD
jgi:hypothetical protein